MPIKGLSEQRVLPRLGKIKLGVFVLTGGNDRFGKPKGYPRATEYFICPPEVQKVYGEQPKELPVTFLVNDIDRVFPQDLKTYKSFGLWCKGDGEVAKRWDEAGHLADRPCPCDLLDSGECKPVATLNVALTAVPGLGVYQMVTRSPTAIKQINSALAQTAAAVGGIRGVRFLLKLRDEGVPRFDEKTKTMVRTKIHVPFLTTAASLDDVMAQRKALGAGVDPLMLMPASSEAEPDDDPETESRGVDGALVERPGRAVSPIPDHTGGWSNTATAPATASQHDDPAPPAASQGKVEGKDDLLLDEVVELALSLDVDRVTATAYVEATQPDGQSRTDYLADRIVWLRESRTSPGGAGAAKAAMKAGARGQARLV